MGKPKRNWNPSPRRRELFWRFVDQSGGEDACWPWMLTFAWNGYGHSTVDGWRTTAHRLAYALTYGLFNDRLVVRHFKCDNPRCCNPKHLKLGTQAENLADMRAKGRGGDCRVFGEKHGRCKLTDAQIREIRLLGAQGETQWALAHRFGVGQSQIGRIIRGETRIVPTPT